MVYTSKLVVYFSGTAPPGIHTLSLHDALPISMGGAGGMSPGAVPVQIDLERALERLSETARAVVWLHDVEGYTHEEIAEQMGKRSEEHTSELQSRGHLVCRLLLEKKKKHTIH